MSLSKASPSGADRSGGYNSNAWKIVFSVYKFFIKYGNEKL